MGEPVTHVAIIHGGGEPHYLYGLVAGLASLSTVRLDVIDADITADWFSHLPNVRFYNLRGRVDSRSVVVRALRDIRYHLRLCLYILASRATVIHIQWETRPYLFERYVLLGLYKLLGKKVILTAHNVDRYARDQRVGALYRRSLHYLYSHVDAIIVHTPAMKEEISQRFSIPERKVRVIRHGINTRVPKRGISQRVARSLLKIDHGCKVILFFGNIARYKNVQLLLEAFQMLVQTDESYRLIIAGRPKDGRAYVDELKAYVARHSLEQHCMLRFEFIPDDEVETYFMAADCLVLPYRAIFQSGVIFLSYRFGLPIIATDIGSFREDIIEGETGFLSRPDSADDLARTIGKYFTSDLFRNLENTRQRISTYAGERYAWFPIAQETFDVYRRVLQ